MKKLSVVIPAYNEEKMVPKTAKTVSGLLKAHQIPYELIFVNDGSKDGTWQEIEKAVSTYPGITGVQFSRNFGKESAILAGLATATGDCCAVMDCDLQHPPETLLEIYRLGVRKGIEVVEGVKHSRGKESALHKASAGMFYKIMTKAVGIDMSRASDFKLMDKKAVEALLVMPERNTFFRALSSWIGYRTTSVEFDVQEREEGESKWSTWSLIKYALRNIIGFSTAPMADGHRGWSAGIVHGHHLRYSVLVQIFPWGHALEGFTTVILLLLIIGSIIMISLGIIGCYISKIYEEVKGRPRYLVSRKIVSTVPENEK